MSHRPVLNRDGQVLGYAPGADERDVITPLPPTPPVIGTEPTELLTGDLARAYSEFQYAARELEGKHTAYVSAQERYRVALAKFTKLATGG